MITSGSLLQEWCARVLNNQRVAMQQRLLSDVIMRDVIAASAQPAHWSPQGVFRKQFLNEDNVPTAYDVAYTCSAGLCMRLQGVFDYQQQRWLRQRRIVLGRAPFKEVRLTPVLSTGTQQALVHHVATQMVGQEPHNTLVATYRLRSVAVPYAG